MRDTLPKRAHRVECAVVNLDENGHNGTHWVAYYKNPTETIYFDSFGLDPPAELIAYFGPNTEITSQTFQLQTYDDFICGHLCVYVLQKLSCIHKFVDIILSLI